MLIIINTLKWLFVWLCFNTWKNTDFFFLPFSLKRIKQVGKIFLKTFLETNAHNETNACGYFETNYKSFLVLVRFLVTDSRSKCYHAYSKIKYHYTKIGFSRLMSKNKAKKCLFFRKPISFFFNFFLFLVFLGFYSEI